jgi:hypothetical protein
MRGMMTAGAKRAVWVTCAVVGLGMIVAASVCRGTSRPPAPVIAGTELKLGSFAAVEGTDVFRAELHDGSGGYSSGYERTRNIAFIENGGKGRWLLPDDAHTVVEHSITSRSGILGPISASADLKAQFWEVSGKANFVSTVARTIVGLVFVLKPARVVSCVGRDRARQASRELGSDEAVQQGMKLTSAEPIERSQLIPSARLLRRVR